MAGSGQIIWAAVPNGVDPASGQLKISVHVAPTLSVGAGSTLDKFTDWIDWPATVAAAPLTLQAKFFNASNNAVVTGGGPVTIDTTVLRSDLWTALFSPPANVAVNPRDAGEPFTHLPVISFPADFIANWLKTNYTNWANNAAGGFPAYQDLIALLNPIGLADEADRKRLGATLKDLQDERNAVVGGKANRANDFSATSDEAAFAALRAYHQPHPPSAHALAATPLPTVDFHRALTFIGEHRALQRALGLVFDIAVTVPRAAPAAVLVSVTPSYTGGGAYPAVSPLTTATLGATAWRAQPSSSSVPVHNGQLTLGDATAFFTHQLDVDGGGLKAAIFADNVKLSLKPQKGTGQTSSPPAPDAPTSFAPPTLRSGGLTVTAVNRGLTFVSKLDRSATLMAGLPTAPVLFAEDLVRGYVLDVHDSTGGGWNSTAMRTGSYVSGALPALTAADEAAIDAPPTMPGGSATPTQLNLAENLVRWDGWSLAGPRPGTPIQDDGTAAGGGVAPGPFSQLQTKLGVKPGSLPRLRFGTTYALRMRIVDITGNVIDIGAGANVGDPDKVVSTPAPYRRMEPVASPAVHRFLAAGLDPRPGESLKRLVIRGNFDTESVETSVRGLAPPRSSQLFAEHHGMFDVGTPGSVTLDKTTYTLIAARESALYPDAEIVPTDPVPYLPDPLARGAALTVTDGPLAGHSIVPDFSPAAGHAWPDYRPYRLVLAPGPAALLTADLAQRAVTFALTKGDTAVARLSTGNLTDADLALLGVYGWVADTFGGPGQVPIAKKTAAATGQNWAITPYTELELVYAVRQPLLTPEFVLASNRDPGDTFANLRGEFIPVSRKSTSKVDLLAQWNEPVDDPSIPGDPSGPGAPDTAGVTIDRPVFPITIAADGGPDTDDIQGRQEFFDTKHRVITYSTNATSRFTEYFVETLDVVATPGTTAALDPIGVEPGSVKVAAKVGSATYVEGTHFAVNAAAPASIAFLAAAPGVEVTVTYLPPVSRLCVTPKTVSIDSSARPASIRIREVVPIYQWATPSGKSRGHTKSSVRSPSALRIYMERPWWSSGVGELLGVLTWPKAEPHPGPAEPVDDASSLFVSDWGADPVFDGAKLPALHPTLATFPKSPPEAHATNLSIDERAGVKVNVAGHPVAFDPERKLWYCDVLINIGKAYTPMIRLAVARYQPSSLTGLELGRVVLADIMSLEPGRTVTVTRSAANSKLLTSVSLSGYSYTNAADLAGKAEAPGVAQVTVEFRDTTVADPLLGWKAFGKPIAMKAKTAQSGLTTWTAKNVKLPKNGTARLYVEQFEVLPTDSRGSGALYVPIHPSKPTALRLLHQDIVPL